MLSIYLDICNIFMKVIFLKIHLKTWYFLYNESVEIPHLLVWEPLQNVKKQYIRKGLKHSFSLLHPQDAGDMFCFSLVRLSQHQTTYKTTQPTNDPSCYICQKE